MRYNNKFVLYKVGILVISIGLIVFLTKILGFNSTEQKILSMIFTASAIFHLGLESKVKQINRNINLLSFRNYFLYILLYFLLILIIYLTII